MLHSESPDRTTTKGGSVGALPVVVPAGAAPSARSGRASPSMPGPGPCVVEPASDGPATPAAMETPNVVATTPRTTAGVHPSRTPAAAATPACGGSSLSSPPSTPAQSTSTAQAVHARSSRPQVPVTACSKVRGPSRSAKAAGAASRAASQPPRTVARSMVVPRKATTDSMRSLSLIAFDVFTSNQMAKSTVRPQSVDYRSRSRERACMGWDHSLEGLFDDLEQQAEGLALSDRDALVAEQRVAEYARVDLAARLHGSVGRHLACEVAGVGRVEGELSRVG